MSNDDLYKNVALNFSIPKTKPTYVHWTQDEVKRVLLQINKEDYFNHLVYTMIHFYFYTGLIVNEATATCWTDIDFDKKKLHVNHMLIKEKGKKTYRQNYTKTDAGNRIIPLNSFTIELLKEWKERQKNHGINSDFVFSDTGKPLYSQRIAKKMNVFAENAGVKKIPLQRLRHSNATYLYRDLKIDLEDIKQRFGHKDITTLLRYYIENRNDPNIEVAQKIDDSINSSLTSNKKII
ncbi:tyrosine-type recombinase/integrase [Carnobacterium sp. FSL E2-0243]|uniref:tyrosine-type recombinase/integrase n=1 Tax=Carnobacterium sp. FSL E2-0243 TaxID=2921365 RepID=UPI0030F8BA56